MKKHKGIPEVYDYWFVLNNVYAVVKWPEEKESENKSNLYLTIREYNDYPENI